MTPNLRVLGPCDLSAVDCCDVAVTAAEGGIGYWSQIETYDFRRWSPDELNERYYRGEVESTNLAVADDFVFYVIHEAVDVDDPSLGYREEGIAVTPDLLRRGWAMLDEKTALHRTSDMGDVDSEVADCVVQLGAFGEVRYG